MDLFRNIEYIIYFLMFYKCKCSHFFQIHLGIQGGISFSSTPPHLSVNFVLKQTF